MIESWSTSKESAKYKLFLSVVSVLLTVYIFAPCKDFAQLSVHYRLIGARRGAETAEKRLTIFDLCGLCASA